jgi:alkanesulfonate monooxygenase SsuD/methylene tetrahydromethanopterin reductase-like flavin-dependent oxidoreductase (luciferase family)
MPMEMLLPPGYLTLASMKGVMQAKKAITGGARTVEQLIEQGVFLCGSPETVRQRIADFQGRARFNTMICNLQFGTLPADLTRRNMDMFAHHVLPHLQNEPAIAAAG